MDTNNSLHKLSEVASRIKELRDIMGWSVEEMAEKTDVTVQKYTAYENAVSECMRCLFYRDLR